MRRMRGMSSVSGKCGDAGRCQIAVVLGRDTPNRIDRTDSFLFNAHLLEKIVKTPSKIVL